jgi:tetratricopeptide (TPR) repeat protein
MSAPTTDPVARARDAAARESWAEAYALLHAHDARPTRAVAARDLSALAEAAWWAGHVEESAAARLRAHAAHVAAGDHRGAGLEAWWLHHTYAGLDRPAAAAGWLRRARHHLDGLPPCPEQCFLAWTDAERAAAHGDAVTALTASHLMTTLAACSGSPDLIALAQQTAASVLLAQGRRPEALALLDEAVRAATSGALSGRFTGLLLSLALTRCLRAADLPRAVAWTDAATAWAAAPWTGRPARASASLAAPSCENPFRGVFRARRAEVLDLLGAWTRAESEARQACHEIPADQPEAAAAAYRTIGDVQRRQGRLAEAARSYARVHDLDHLPQPGLALLRLAQGRPDAAVAGLDLALAHQDDPRRDLLGRSRLLAARTEAGLAAGDVRGAARAAAALHALAGDAPLPRALAGTAYGAVCLARTASGSTAEAVAVLRRARDAWLAAGVPYEAARTRTLLAAAYRTAGDPAAARRELASARDAFHHLGARPDADRAAALLRHPRTRPPGGGRTG